MNVSFRSLAYRAVVLSAATTGLIFSRAGAVPPASEVIITHQKEKGQILVQHGKPLGVFPAGKEIKLRAKHDEQVSFIVADSNTLVFDYKLGELKDANTSDYEAFKKLAEAFAKAFPTKADESPAPVLLGARAISKRNPAPPTTDTAPVILSVDGVTVDAREVVEAARELSRSGKQIPGVVRKSMSAPLTDEDFDAAHAEAHLATMQDLLKFFHTIARDPLAKNIQVTGQAPMNLRELETKYPDIGIRFSVRAELAQDVLAFQQFVDAYKKYRRELVERVVVGRVNGHNQLDRSQPVIIAANPAFTSDPTVQKYVSDHSGAYTFVVSPLQTFRYKIGAGAIYSFVRNPEYSVASSPSGTLTVAEKSSDYNKLGGAVTLNVYPDKLFDEGVKWFGQLGASPAKDANALLLGAGFDAYSKFNLSAGIIYQQRRELGGGQTVGATLAKAEDLNVRHRFKTGFYIQLGLAY